jgi:putative spermidine/putrescine transport system substrate-binding protein
MTSILQDSLSIVAEKVRTGRMSRRRFLEVLAALGAVGALPTWREAHAETKELVFCMWGGDAEDVYRKAWNEPYEAKTGIAIALDGSGPTRGKIRAMVESKNVTWDVCDSGLGTQSSLGPEGLLEPIDYTIVDKSKIVPGLAYQWGSTGYIYSSVLTWDNQAFGGEEPKTWADFWDLKRFPGKRVLWKYMVGVLEAALMADGVAPDKVYPIDMDRALNKIKEIKDHLVLWDNGASSQQVFRDGEVTMGQIWHTRSTMLGDESQGRFKYTFNQGLVQPGVWVVPKGNPAGKAVFDFLASMQEPEKQLILLKELSQGPANPETAKLAPELAGRNPASPENLAIQVFQNEEWYAKNHQDAEKRYLDVVSS